MQQKTNIDQRLAEAFKSLAVKTPIEKITIKEITDKAGVIRPTFYNHFQDKYELLEWIIWKEVIEPVIQLMRKGFFKEGVTQIFTNALKLKEFCIQAVKTEGQNSFRDIVHNCIKEMLLDYIGQNVNERELPHRWMTPELIADYYAQAMTFVVVTWIQKDMAISPEEMADIYEYIVSRSMEDILNEM